MPKVLNQTLAPAQPPVDPYEEMITRQLQRMQEVSQRASMYTPEQIEERRAQNQREYELGLLGALSGSKAMQGVGGTVLKTALEQRTPKITERGIADQLSCEFRYDPDYLQQLEGTKLQALERLKAAADVRRDEQARQREFLAQQQAERRQTQVLLKTMGGGAQAGSFTPSGFTPDGRQVVTNTKSGVSYLLDLKPDGTPSYTPYGGAAVPKATFEKQTVEAQEAHGGAQRADALIGAVQASPEAFGLKAAMVGSLPGPLQGWAGGLARLTPEQQQLRAQVTRDASMELNRIYGAAQSAGELARASAWAPNATDPLESIINKLTAARDWERGRTKAFGPGVERAARQRSGGATGAWETPPATAPAGPTGAPAGGAGGWGMRLKQ